MPHPRRYQLRKDAVAIVERGHPWLFRDQLSTAAGVFADGDWLRLVDGANRIVAHGIFEARGAVAIRVLRRGPEPPDAAWLRAQLAAALRRREPLHTRTDAIRLVHGESDGIAAVTADRFGDAIVIASYSAGADLLARYLARALRAQAATIYLRAAHRRQPAGTLASDDPTAPRLVAGTPRTLATFTEDGLAYSVDLAAGQKTGAYLDLRGLRHWIATAPLAGARVLNLFAYTGMLGRAAEHAGAAAITQVDASERALAFARTHHVTDPGKHTFITADIFEWFPALPVDKPYDLVIVDPPAMTSSKAQVPAALAAYRRLYQAAARQLAPGGAIVAACCTSRIERATFHRTVREALGPAFSRELELPVEPDHPVGFAQADYLKIAIWRLSPPSQVSQPANLL